MRQQAEQSFPDYEVKDVRAERGAVTLLFAKREGVGTFAIALRASGTQLFTSRMSVRIEAAELARATEALGSWHARAALQQMLVACSESAPDGTSESPEATLHGAVEATLADQDRGTHLAPQNIASPVIVVGALMLSLTIVMWPGRGRLRRSTPRVATIWRDRILILFIALVGVTIGFTIARHMAPEDDEIVTLGTRHVALSFLLSWADGGEPFNPPGAPTMFGLWLRVADGFFSARGLSLAFIPLAAFVAYRAGTAMAGRGAGLSFAALLITAPAYLRLAALARAYAMIVFSLCLILAMVARTKQTASRGELVGVASLIGLWVSYLLWPLALAAPWIARLDSRTRLRLTAALALMVAALAPRMANGFTEAMKKHGTFELHGVADTLGHVLAIVGQAPPLNCSGNGELTWPARAVAVVLMSMAVVQLWRRDPHQLRDTLLVLALVVLPVLALLTGGHGIRDRHVIAVHVGLSLLAAIGLGLAVSRGNGSTMRTIGWLLASALAILSFLGNRAVVRSSNGWIYQLDRICGPAELILTVPQSAQGSVFAMLFGDAPEGSESIRWPPVCNLGTERQCRRVGEQETVSVNELTDGIFARAEAVTRSVWIFDLSAMDPALGLPERIPARLRHCDHPVSGLKWLVFDCASTTVLRE